ncbi:MAG: CPBP family intramembrane metalloprotease [Xanthomonadales bacterium]|nr:CPBP family intramembrane metalloprotease [Xanthomonadales bacterium]
MRRSRIAACRSGILERAWGTLPAMWLQSLVFSAMHLANAEDRASTVELLTTAVSGVLLGALWTMVYVYAQLRVVTAHHAAWNFTIILAGVPLSGLEDWRQLAPTCQRISRITLADRWRVSDRRTCCSP